MGKNLQNEVEYYYDTHPTEEDLMGETSIHSELIDYLKLVLKWLFRGQRCAIYKNLNFYQTADPDEYPVAPDIAVVKGVDYDEDLNSWKVGRTGPVPQVVFEIASEETWKNDVEKKPFKYAQMGVAEYFFYNPKDSPHQRRTRRRLLGWQLDQATGEMRSMSPDEQGRLWSEHLASFLVPDGKYLRLYDSNMQLRLTGEEALAQEKEALLQKTEALIQKLRSLGIKPDEL